MSKVYFDPGHGGNDPGAVGNGLREKDLVLKIAKYAREALKAYKDVDVRMSRTGGTYPSLSGRAAEANSWGADLFVSIHCNAFVSTANGYEDFIFNGAVSKDTPRLQTHTHREISPLFRVDRGKKRANFAVLRLTKMPAVLTESGFITNKADADFLKKDSNLKKIGEAHAEAIAKYLGLSKASTPKSPPSPSPTNRVQWIGTDDKGKELEIIVPEVNYYNSQRWTNPTASRPKGYKWKIDNLYTVNGSLQYRVQDANGNLFYTTARKDLVRVGGEWTSDGMAPDRPQLSARGWWGKNTTRSLQITLGTPVDGEIWGQSNNPVTRAIQDGVKFGTGGSPMIRAFQRHIGMSGSQVDGYLGPQTFGALQRYLGTPVDGEMWTPSTAAREMQRRLNAGTF